WLSNTVSEGIVSAFREIDAMRWMQITAPISQGSSGGPVLNHAGQVVGVAAALMEGGQNINFAVPVADLRAVLNSPAGRLAFPSSVGGVPSTPASQGTESYANYFDSFLTVRLREPVTGALETTDLQFDSGAFADYYRVDGP